MTTTILPDYDQLRGRGAHRWRGARKTRRDTGSCDWLHANRRLSGTDSPPLRGRSRFLARAAFNLDEYFPPEAGAPQSYHRFMREQLFDRIGIAPHNCHSQLDPVFPGGSDPREFFERARDRNRSTARDLQRLGLLPSSRSFDPVYAEVFRRQP